MSVIAEEIDHSLLDVLDDGVLHNIALGCLGPTHLQNASQLCLAAVLLLDQVHVSLLDYVDWIAKHFDASFHFSDGFSHIVKVSVTWLAAWLANCLQSG